MEVIEETILGLLAARAPGKTICPSEAARALGGTEAEWRARMEPVREVARAMEARGDLELTQKGEPVGDPANIRGPIRLRLPPGAQSS